MQTKLRQGVPGFLVEVSLMPKNSEPARSKVYVTAKPQVHITLRETFCLNCTAEDLKTQSLFIAIRPIFGNLLLFAETELTLLSGKKEEVYLGGYLKGVFQSEKQI